MRITDYLNIPSVSNNNIFILTADVDRFERLVRNLNYTQSVSATYKSLEWWTFTCPNKADAEALFKLFTE